MKKYLIITAFFLLSIVFASNSSALWQDNLVFHYTMDNISGTTLFDELGSYAGTLENTDMNGYTGYNGDSLYFKDGAGYGNYITNLLQTPDTAVNHTLCFWIKVNNPPATGVMPVYYSNPNGYIRAQFEPDGDLSTGVWTGGYDEAVWTGAVSELSDWSLLCSRWFYNPPVGDEFRLFVNGSEVASVASSGYITANTETFIFGYDGGQDFDMYLDDIWYWAEAKTHSEISTMFNESLVTPYTAIEIINSSFNLTSDGGCVSFPCNTSDNTPTITFDTTEVGNCSLRNISHSFDNSFICSTSNDTTHICTLFSADKLVYGYTSELFVSCYDGITEVNSSALEVNYLGVQWSITDNNYPLDSNGAVVDSFSTQYLEEIEKVIINFTFNQSINLNNWYFNFSANGSGACSLGNIQNDYCYSYTNDSYKWIQFINGTLTTNYDGAGGNTGDKIEVLTANDSQITLRIDEHYNPNVMKLYNARYDWSNVTWLNGSQAISKNQLIKVCGLPSIVPLDADQYKLDFRATYSSIPPTSPLQIYLCNTSYSVGLPSGSSNCDLIDSKLPADFQDDGTKVRTIFTKNTIDTLNNIGCVVLYSAISNPLRYYNLKTYEATNLSHSIAWSWSDDAGLSWTQGTDTESEINLNWFYAGISPTEMVYSLYTQSDEGVSNSLTNSFVWKINASQNYAPVVNIISPITSGSLTLPATLSFNASDTNIDSLNLSMYLYDSGVLQETFFTDYTENNNSFYLNWTNLTGTYDLIFIACENGTTEEFCVNDTHYDITFNQPDNDTLSCFYQDSPKYMFKGFYALCYSNLNNMSCYGTLDYNGRIVQVSPERVIINNNEASDFFESDDGSVMIYFSNDNLKDEVSVNMSIFCTDGTSGLVFQEVITPQLRHSIDQNNFLVHIINNADYFIGGLVVAIIFLYLVGRFISKE